MTPDQELIATLPERLTRRIEVDDDGHWMWLGQVNNKGYGMTNGKYPHQPLKGARKRPAHVIVYEFIVGPVPIGMELDHVCRVPLCVNPDEAHLEPVTHAENQRRAGVAQTHCRRAGHPYSTENTYRRPGGQKRCRECSREADRRRAPRRSAAA